MLFKVICHLCKKASWTLSRGLCTESKSKTGYNVLFYGTDKFSTETLSRLYENNCLSEGHLEKVVNSLDVVSKNDSLVVEFAKKRNLNYQVWPCKIPKDKYDLGIVVSFGHLIPSEHIKSCRLGILNIHGSLLPRWRGASPIHHAILAGDKETGVTIMKIKANKFDVGEVLCHQSVELTEDSTTAEVYKELAWLGSSLMMEVLRDLTKKLSNAVPQSNENATAAPKPKAGDGLIVFATMAANEVDRRCRALSSLVNLFTYWVDGTELKLHNYVKLSEVQAFNLDSLVTEDKLVPGHVFYHKKRKVLCFRCADGNWVAFRRLALKGKKQMTALEFYNGYVNQLQTKNSEPIVLKEFRAEINS
ncbi:Methionyl-tRNA formyltransferase, mitochondrial [Halotydeus destructor]|nr:Methionyl-tRNA formyltransferase, mitochondrial [Halotydeus destructor]